MMRGLTPRDVVTRVAARYTIKSDVWAYGVLIWEVMTFGQKPFQNYSAFEIIEEVLSRQQTLDIPYTTDFRDIL